MKDRLNECTSYIYESLPVIFQSDGCDENAEISFDDIEEEQE